MNYEVTGGDLVKLRGKGHASKVYLAGLDAPAVVFSARISQTFGTLDRIGDVQFDGAVGNYEDVRIGQTVWFGTTSGGHDIGRGRIRKLAEVDTLYIGETSELALDNDQYITVVDEYLPWSTPLHVDDDGELCADYDVIFTDQYTDFEPVPVLGPDWVAVSPLTLTTVTLNDDNASITYSGSWIYFSFGFFGAYMGDLHLTDAAGAYAELEFFGKSVKWMSRTNSNYGYADVYIDDVLIERVDTYSASLVEQVYVFEHNFSTYGTHTIKIVAVGSGRGGTSVWVDAIEYVGAETDTTIAPDASDSWCIESTISTYEWEAPGSSASSDLDTATPSITYDTEGLYHIYCTVTAANGKATTGVRRVYVVFNPTSIITNNVTIEPSEGGADFSAELYNDVDTVLDRARVILWADDRYNGTAGSIGPLRQNILACGFINGESIRRSTEGSAVSFSVGGLGKVLDSMAIMPISLDLASNIPTTWQEMPNLTVDRGLFFALHYLSNITRITDVYLTDDTRLVKKLEATERSMWGILQTFGERIGALPFASNLDVIKCAIDPQLIPEADRDWDTVMTITSVDIVDPFDAEKVTTLDASQIDISGRKCDASGREKSYYSLAYGHTPGITGSPITSDTWITESQAQLNQIAGLLNGWRNNPYPDLSIRLGGNYRIFDCMPYSYVALSLASDLRGTMAFNIIPRSVSYEFFDGGIITTLEAEAETFETLNTDGDIPNVDEDFSDPPTPRFPPFPPFPPGGDLTIRPKRILIKEATRGLLYTENGDDPDPTKVRWEFVNAGLDDDHKVDMSEILVTGYGKIYLAYMKSESVFTVNQIWSAEAPGGIFTEAVNKDYLDTAFSEDDSRLVAVGINTLASDQIAFVAGAQESIVWRLKNALFWGNTSGFSTGTLWDCDMYPQVMAICGYRGFSLSFGAGEWCGTGWSYYGGGTSLYTFNTSGGIVSVVDGGATWGRHGQGVHHARIGSTNKMYLLDAYGENIWDIDNAGTANDIGETLNDGNRWNFACDPSGQYIMANPSGTPSKSSDFGYSWSALTAVLPIGTKAFDWAKYDPNRWVAARATINFTEDFGTSWTDMSGNLSYVCPLPNVEFIKVIE